MPAPGQTYLNNTAPSITSGLLTNGKTNGTLSCNLRCYVSRAFVRELNPGYVCLGLMQALWQ